MKPLNYLIIAFLVLLVAGCQKKEVPAELQKQLDSVVSVMVPQHGESLCDVNLIAGKGGEIIVKGVTNLPEAKEEIIALISESGYSYADSITVLPDPEVVSKPWGLISVSVCNMRTTPSDMVEMASQALMGTPVKILDKKKGWYLIQTPDSYLGWTDDPLAELSDNELNEWKESERLIYLENNGVITSEKGDIVSDIVFGVILRITGSDNSYFSVVLPDGRTGKVKRAEATDFRNWAENTRPDVKKMIPFAQSFMGIPYLWGGTSPKAIDCSGFTKTIYYYGGVILTRDASGQFRYGDEVSIEKPCETLQPGDLLYFGRVKDGKKRITHTGMYIGDTEFIHSSGMVKVNSLDSTRENYSEYLLNILQGARRVNGYTEGKGIQLVINNDWYF